MTTITVVDSIMGSGKTTFAIDLMKSQACAQSFGNPEQAPKFVYITPYLDEVGRVCTACPEMDFTAPKPIRGRKLEHFKELIEEGRNIASTHALFLLSDQEVHEVVSNQNYTLIIDEETECVKEYDEISKSDVATLYRQEMIYTEESGLVRWNHEKHADYFGRFNDVKRLCDIGALVRVDASLFVWRFPIDFLRMFRRVYVLTYLFEGSLMSAYLRANRMGYEVKTLREGVEVEPLERLAPYSPEREAVVLAEVRPLLTVIEDEKLNAIGKRVGKAQPLSVSWYETAKRSHPERIKKVKDAAETFYRHRAIGNARDRMWTCVTRFKPELRGKKLTAPTWTPCNLRATNEHRKRRHLAYLHSMFIHPKLCRYFTKAGVQPNHDLYALSALVQWVWRSQIRDGKGVTLFVPSERMRELLKRWLAGEGSTIAHGGEGEPIYEGP